MKKFLFKDYKYQVITKCYDNGLDEKPEVKNMAQAKESAKWYLNNGYDEVYILSETKVVRVFDAHHKQGRKPYDFETKQFNFDTPKVQNAVQLSINF